VPLVNADTLLIAEHICTLTVRSQHICMPVKKKSERQKASSVVYKALIISSLTIL